MTAYPPTPNFSDALVLVSCAASKLEQPSPAKQLYCSDWFIKARTLVEKHNVDWLILSALHGVVEPDTILTPYNKTLNTMTAPERKEWAAKTYDQLTPYLKGRKRIIIFAGRRYYEYLSCMLHTTDYEVDIPMKNLKIGEQLSWLKRQSEKE